MLIEYQIVLEILLRKLRQEMQGLDGFGGEAEAMEWMENEIAWALERPAEYISANK